MNKTSKSILIFLIFYSSWLIAQKNIIKHNMGFYKYSSQIKFNCKWYNQTDIQDQYFMDPVAQYRFLVRSYLHKALGDGRWEASLGGALVFQNPSDPNAKNTLTIPEQRPRLEFSDETYR